jgi:hypothetical protein
MDGYNVNITCPKLKESNAPTIYLQGIFPRGREAMLFTPKKYAEFVSIVLCACGGRNSQLGIITAVYS